MHHPSSPLTKKRLEGSTGEKHLHDMKFILPLVSTPSPLGKFLATGLPSFSLFIVNRPFSLSFSRSTINFSNAFRIDGCNKSENDRFKFKVLISSITSPRSFLRLEDKIWYDANFKSISLGNEITSILSIDCRDISGLGNVIGPTERSPGY
jgi:hypothetical protein